MPIRLLKKPIQLSINYMRLRYGEGKRRSRKIMDGLPPRPKLVMCNKGLTLIQLDILNLIESKKRSSVQEIQSKFKLSEEQAEKEIEDLMLQGYLIDRNNPPEEQDLFLTFRL